MKKRLKVDTELVTVLVNNTIVLGRGVKALYIYSLVCFLLLPLTHKAKYVLFYIFQ